MHPMKTYPRTVQRPKQSTPTLLLPGDPYFSAAGHRLQAAVTWDFDGDHFGLIENLGALDIVRTAARFQMVQGNEETLTFVSEANTRAGIPYRANAAGVRAKC